MDNFNAVRIGHGRVLPRRDPPNHRGKNET